MRNAKDPILAGSTLITVAHRKDSFTNGGAGGCYTSQVHFNQYGIMVGGTWALKSSTSYTLNQAAKSDNGTIGLIYNGKVVLSYNSGSSWTSTLATTTSGKIAFDSNNKAWLADGTNINGLDGNTGSYSFTNGTITDINLGQDGNLYSISMASNGFTVAKYNGTNWTESWISNYNSGNGKLTVDSNGHLWIAWTKLVNNVPEVYLTYSEGDYDSDGLHNSMDNCAFGDSNWTSNSTTDHDGDGCQDSNEDLDDDDDSISDTLDSCSKGDLNWTSTSTTDHDGDGCQDSNEDLDDDDDSISDTLDACSKGDLDWVSNSTNDYDTDGCQDSTEDLDDDDDSISDTLDSCVKGFELDIDFNY